MEANLGVRDHLVVADDQTAIMASIAGDKTAFALGQAAFVALRSVNSAKDTYLPHILNT